MRKFLLILLFLAGVFFQFERAKSTEADGSVKAERTAIETITPDSTLTRFFELLQDGQSSSAEKLFLVRNSDQKSAVSQYVSGGIAFFQKMDIKNQVVETFEEGHFSICAIEQTSDAFPGKSEVECGYLVFKDGQWLLLPQQQDYHAKLNGLLPVEIAAFKALHEEFSLFKRSYKK